MDTQVFKEQRVDVRPTSYRWTRRQYDQMIEVDILREDDRVELINGEIIERSPQGSRHSLYLAAEALRSAYPDGYLVRVQLPIVLDPDAEPEPDVAVISGNPRDYLNEHPTIAILVVEVADTTLDLDREEKARLYARHQIPEYWILNVGDDCLEVYRDPVGETYQTKTTLHRGDSITPPKAANAIAVADLLP